MGNKYYNIVSTVLLLMHFDRTRSIQDPCSSCTAGFFCERNKNQSCIPCPPNSFSSTSGQKACNLCRKCEGVFRTKRACSSTQDAECECVLGYYCVGARCTKCKEDCKQGQELTKDGCKNCEFGKFNDQKNGRCQLWTNCSLFGKSVLVNGTKESDVVCGPTSKDSSPDQMFQATVFMALTSTVLLLSVIFLVLYFSFTKHSRKKLLYIFKQPFIKPVQTAQEEDSCSCRFPEEEEGENEP